MQFHPGLAFSIVAIGMTTPTAYSEPIKITKSGLGCFDKHYAEKLFTYSIEGDREALTKAITDAVIFDLCREFKVGQVVYREELEIFGLQCLRPPGETRCLWTLQTLTH
mgnify:FL=1